ncbi:hypothetical protein [Polaribacter dokdonensis]|uniref:HNH endonuclease 5 domain-containing protein n=1 Tax=Polaribacter dokdonensis DSW-5 TaxID=1300348 RepID=A0A0M9CH75_9FLAO|nr:hypothetical protein [Polaribacter dokdonensis]KOY52423.1 hypothetical protein I602_1983 [Polaribacter dokdonensis DSW-5]SEE45211.1 hypothetical protein SAMN05444353_1754 [Polaribacter dokdonensis DSW-5]
MKNKKTKIGICRICKEEKELNFEHIPPRSAFNKSRYQIVDSTEYYTKVEKYLSKEEKIKTKVEQGGIGDYCLCFDCNSFLGSKYVREYKKFANICMSIITHEDKNAKAYQFDISDINHLKFLKQIIAIFICNNQSVFTDQYPELIDFVKDPELEKLSDRYKIYMYLNNEGQVKKGTIFFTNLYGAICDFTFPPFGFVLSIDNDKPLDKVTDITGFKFYNKYKSLKHAPIILNKYPTYYPFPLDFRSFDGKSNSM